MTPPEPEPEPEQEPGRGGLSRRYLWAAGVIIGSSYAVGAIARGDVAPGIVGGVLAAILTFLVLREASERRRRRGR